MVPSPGVARIGIVSHAHWETLPTGNGSFLTEREVGRELGDEDIPPGFLRRVSEPLGKLPVDCRELMGYCALAFP